MHSGEITKVAKGGHPTSIGKMKNFGKPASIANISNFGETICVYLLSERFDTFKKIDNYRSTIQKTYCRQADKLTVFEVYHKFLQSIRSVLIV